MKQHQHSLRWGIIGGSGFYHIPGVEIVKEHRIETPFGKPSDAIIELLWNGKSVFFLPRHGKGHSYSPSKVPYKANIWAMKKIGVSHLLSLSAVGIMQEHISPGDLVIPDQIYDATKGIRDHTYFNEGISGHVSFAEPYCKELNVLLNQTCQTLGFKSFLGGTYVCIEGSRFSSKAESHFFRKTLTPSVIGMTAMPEAALAREAEIPYAALALGTDFDCWHESQATVTTKAVIEVLQANVVKAQKVVSHLISHINQLENCDCQHAARHAILTKSEYFPQETKDKLKVFYGKYWN